MLRAAKHCASGCAQDLRSELPACQVSFEAGDIVTQVMSFGSPTPVEVAVQGVSLAGRLRLRAEGPGATGEAELSSAICNSRRRYNYPTLDINIDRERAGPIRTDHGGRGAFGGAGHFVLAIHRSELLARSELRQRVPDSGGAAAEPDAKR